MTQQTTAFCGLPSARLGAIPQGTVAGVLGAGHSLGTPNAGAENGPFFLRTLSKAYTWAAATPGIYDLRRRCAPLTGAVDLGDIDFGGMALDEALSAVETAVGALPPSVVPAVIGGDHTVTSAVVTALAARREAPFNVVQFDHHLDLQIWDGAPGRAEAPRESIFHTNVMSHVSDRIGQGRLIQVGVAPYATVEMDSMHAMPGYFEAIGEQVSLLSPVLEDAAAFQSVVGRGRDVYLTVDVDVLDQSAMSSTGYPAAVGLGLRELLRLIDLTLSCNRLIGFDVVEFAAARDARDAKTLADAGRAALIFLHLLGWACLQASGGIADVATGTDLAEPRASLLSEGSRLA